MSSDDSDVGDAVGAHAHGENGATQQPGGLRTDGAESPSPAELARVNKQLLGMVEKLSRENQQLRRQLRVVESKVSGGFGVIGNRIGGLEKSLVAITSAATAGLLGNVAPRALGAAPPPPPLADAPAVTRAAPPRAAPRRPSLVGTLAPSRSAPPPPSANGGSPARRTLPPRMAPPARPNGFGGASGAGAGAGAGADAVRAGRAMSLPGGGSSPRSADSGDSAGGGAMASRLRGVVARKSSVSTVQAKRRSSVTAFALGKISEDDLLQDVGDAGPGVEVGESSLGLTGPKAKIWCGSWNVGAKEPFSGTQEGHAADIAKWAPPGYDLYVVGVQEGVSDSVYDIFAEVTGTTRMIVTKGATDTSDRVLGRGDGSFRHQKFTGIQAFLREGASSFVKFLRVARHSFGVSEGSKGGVGLVLRIWDATIAFVSVHMASKKQELRFAQYKELMKDLGAALGNEFFQMTEQFHHVVFMGDTNYRCSGLTTDEALLYIGSRQHMTMLQLHDQLNEQKRTKMVFHNFEEPVMAPDFYPTYKKFEERGPADYSHRGWVHKVYRVNYKEHFYKGGGVKDRIPGWCDRIQFHSMRDLTGQLTVDMLPARVDGVESTVSSYRSMNDILTISDHSPVCCGFTLHQPPPLRSKELGTTEAVPVRVMLRVYDIEVEDSAQMVVPRVVKVMFPAPYETDAGIVPPARVQKEKGVDSLSVTLSWDATCAEQMPRLHLLLKAQTDKKNKGHCVVSMQELVASLDEEGLASHTFFEPMCCDGVPRSSSDGRQLHVQFTIAMKMVASPVESLRERRRTLAAGMFATQ